PLWPTVIVRASFLPDADLSPLCDLLRDSCSAVDLSVTGLEESAWKRGLRQTVEARSIGRRLWLAPADDETGPADRTRIRLNMGLAFGTGAHPTTALCLEWLDAHLIPGATVIDYGCGSGVLAIAALALGASRAWAVDNDSQALLATSANAALNGVSDRLFVGAPESLPAVTVDVLVANILAAPLIELAPAFTACLKPEGALVLSGVLEHQAPRVAAAFAPHFGAFEIDVAQGWARLAARRNSVKRAQNR
ncbi:MAG TPA: 50S ribosomal protein L11 methyltransferase, partial [Gammaproteobacteria bacterium]